MEEVVAGDIIAIAGLKEATVSNTICSPEIDQPLPAQPIDPPTLSMTFSVNDSPLSGQEGKNLVGKYNIKKVPTVLLSPEASAYEALSQVWERVGTVESDGVFVFREMEAINQTYKDLNNNKIVQAKS